MTTSSARQAAPASQPDADYLLAISDLRVHFASSRGIVHAVDGVSYGVRRGEIVALVGESGSGKSVSALAIMRLLPRTTGAHRQGRSCSTAATSSTSDDADARAARPRHRHDLPGADDLAQSGAADRAADHRAAAHPSAA